MAEIPCMFLIDLTVSLRYSRYGVAGIHTEMGGGFSVFPQRKGS